MKKWLAGMGALTLLAGIVLTGCGANSAATGGTPSSSGSSSKNSGPVTITVGFNKGEISDAEVSAFNKSHKDIQIKMIDVSQAGKIQALLASGNAPDIIRISAASELPSYVIKGIAKDLEPYFKKDQNVFNPDDFLPVEQVYQYDAKNGVQGEGDHYGFVKDWSQDFTLWYNKKIFDAAGIAPPSTTNPMTWEDLVSLAKKMTKTDSSGKIAQYGLGYYGGNMQATQDIVLLQLAQLGKTAWSSDFKKADFESPEGQKVLNMWADITKSNLGPNALNQDTNWAGNLFLQGKMAMFISGYWFSGDIRSSLKNSADWTKFVMAPAPVMKGGKRLDPTGAAVGGIIYSGTKHPDQAWEVFKYLFSGPPADDRAKSGWGIPGFKSKLTELPQNTDWDKQVLATEQKELNYASPFLQYDPFVDETAVNTVLDKYMVPVYYGKDTVQNAAVNIDKDLDNLIKSGMQAAGVK